MLGAITEGKIYMDNLQNAGADMTAVRHWFKKLERVKKSVSAVGGRYRIATDALRKTEELVMHMDELLVSDSIALDGRRKQGNADEIRVTGNIREMNALSRELKKLRNRFDHTFVVAAEDEEFHLIYDTVIRLSASYKGTDVEQLLLQSEAENLLDLMREHLQREQPDIFALCYFYLEKDDKLLKELPPQERVAKVNRICRREFMEAMEQMLREYLKMSETDAAGQVRSFCEAEL